MNICDPNAPNYLECVARNYGGRDDYEQFAPKGYSNEGIGGFNFGDFFSGFSQPQEASMFNPLGFSNQTRLSGLAFGPVGILGSLAVEKFRASQEAKAAEQAAQQKALEEMAAAKRNIQQYTSGGGGGGHPGGAAAAAGAAAQAADDAAAGAGGY